MESNKDLRCNQRLRERVGGCPCYVPLSFNVKWRTIDEQIEAFGSSFRVTDARVSDLNVPVSLACAT